MTVSPAAAKELVLRRPGVLYERLHRNGPVQWNEEAGCWLVVGFELARTVLRDERFRMPGPGADSRWSDDTKLNGFIRGMLLEAEGADHNRIRTAMAPVFGPRSVRDRAVRAKAVLEGLLDEVADEERFSGVAAISSRLPVDVVGDLVGIPVTERADLSELCRKISGGGGLANGSPSADAVQTSISAVTDLWERVRGWLANDASSVPDSALGRVAELRGTPDGLTEAEAVANVFSLYLAGHDTSRNLLSALLLRLAFTEGLFNEVVSGNVDRGALVDRVLRAETPLTFTVRVAAEDTELAGHRIAAGSQLRIMLGAANHELIRDEHLKGPPGGLAFGDGRHVCLGAHVARMEGVVMLDVLARRWASVRPAGEPRWSPHFLHRGLVELPLEVTWRA